MVKAQKLWLTILESQVETGTPYMLYKDHCNSKSNQQNLGTIKSSNLCTEIVEYTSPDEVAVCNLASISLKKFVKPGEVGNDGFDHQKLYDVTRVGAHRLWLSSAAASDPVAGARAASDHVRRASGTARPHLILGCLLVNAVTRNLNKVIDINYYPVDEAEYSNKRHRPVGIGIQGLADTFMELRMPYQSDDAKRLNKEIFETIYFAAMSMSKDLAKEVVDGKKVGPYDS
eukprot:COSAG04_NODE_1036_length_8609_cov_33.941716_9_plen_230_part_00